MHVSIMGDLLKCCDSYSGAPRELFVIVTIVEDSYDLRRLCEMFVKQMGFDTECYADGQAFLDNFAPKPGVVLLGLELPGKSGAEVLRELNELGWNLLVITISAWIGPEDASKILALGAKSHLQLPFKHEQLEAEINRVLGRTV